MSPDTRRSITCLMIVGGAVALDACDRPPRPCARPIAWSIGSIDARFNITADGVIHDARAATAIWNGVAAKTLFEYDPKAPLAINLVYDSRAERAARGAAIGEQRSTLDGERAALDSRKSAFTSDQLAYNRDVEMLNARGGATPDEARALRERKAALDALGDSLKSEVARLNERTDAVNAGVNQFNQQAGQILTAGRYVRDSAGRRIEVFKFVDDDELTRFLAHEFGHALGLDHNGDSTSIMYAMNESGGLVPSAADVASLRAVCGK